VRRRGAFVLYGGPVGAFRDAWLSRKAIVSYPLAGMDGHGLGRPQGFGWLVIATLVIAVLAVPSSARASTGFTFVPDPWQPSLPAGSTLVAVADLTGNGITDLVVENSQNDTLGVMLGNGAGGFGPASSIPLGARPTGAEVAEFNDDGHPDLLVPIETKSQPRELNQVPEAVEILSGDGHGNFTVGPQVALPEPGEVRVGDFTSGGNADVVVTPSGCELGVDRSKLYMLLGDGHGNLIPGPTTADEAHGCGYQVGDFTGDGRDDLVTYAEGFGENGKLIVLPSEPNGAFGPAITTPGPPQAWFMPQGLADFDGNGTLGLLLDRFTEPSTFYVMSGNGSGAFTASGPYASGAPHLDFTPALGDFSGDGRVDIAAVAFGIHILENNGAGVFSPGFVVPLISESVTQAFVADVNGDGRPDIILGDQSGVSIYLDEPVSASASLVSNSISSSSTQVAPLVQSARESAKRWREGNKLARLSQKKGPPIGTTFSFMLNEPAQASFSFTRHTKGRRVRGSCVAETNKNRNRAGCERTVAAGALSFAADGGANKVAFQGRISRSEQLKPGTYTLTIRATNSAGVSNARQLIFTIVK